MAPKISIIIPAYNAEASLPKMLDAIQAQTFGNFEVVIVNDGSKDGTGAVIDARCEADERFRAIHKENGGVSTARNRGLDEATGEYILFFDADDDVPETAVASLYRCARDKMADLVIGQNTVHHMNEVYVTNSSRRLSQKTEIDRYELFLNWNFTLCNKLFRREIIEKNHIRFNGTKHAEDAVFLYQFVFNCSRMTGCPEIVYEYLKRPFWEGSSLSKTVSKANFNDVIHNFDILIDITDQASTRDLEEIRNSDRTEAEKQEAQYHIWNFRSVLFKRYANLTIINEYYRYLWNAEEGLFPMLQEKLQECRANMFPADWKDTLKRNPDLRLELDQGLLTGEEILENPMLSVCVSDKVPQEQLNKVIGSYYNQSYVSFEMIVDQSLEGVVDEAFTTRQNFRFLKHKPLHEFKQDALDQFKGTYAIFVDEDIIPSTNTIMQMIDEIEAKVFITAPLLRYDNGEFREIRPHQTVFINELDVVKVRSPYNELDWMWGNKIFNVKALKSKKILFTDNSLKDMDRLYNNSGYKKFKENAFITTLSDNDILEKVLHWHVRFGYKGKLASEEKRLKRIEKENTRIETAGQRFKNWRLAKMRAAYKYDTLKWVFPWKYRKHCKAPVQENKVIFIVNRKATLPNAMTYVHKVLEDSGKYDVHVHYLQHLTLRYRGVFKRTMALMEDMATAKFVFLDEATPDIGGFDKRPETKVVQLWHGCGAFKKFGFSTADKIFGGNAKEQKRYPMYHNFDLVCVSSPEVVWAYEEAMQLEGQGLVKPVGVSRTDVFFDEAFVAAARKRVYEQAGIPEDKKIILYAPTFRGRVAHAYGPDNFDYDRLYETLGDEYVILIKHHPLVKTRPDIPLEYRGTFVQDVSTSMEIEDLLCASEICISDYSSLIFEFALFEKPIILYAYDLDTYFDWRGFYYDFYEMAPGPVLISTEEIIDYIQHLDTEFDLPKMQAFKEKFMSACDGHSTERIFEEIGLKL